MSEHTRAVERFYAHGAERRAEEADGFLSFGFWKDDTKDYAQAAANLLDLLLSEASIERPEAILNVCCGNGVETARIYERLRPERIHGVDVTRPHIEAARKRAAALGLSDKLVFHHGDAAETSFAGESFSHVVGVEGIAHFDTRPKFLREAHRVLKPGGMLMLTDCILRRYPPGAVNDLAALACAKLWYIPPANRIDAEAYAAQLEESGFRVEFIRGIGDRVFPGFARFNLRPKTVLEAVRTRGLGVGLGLTFISWLLGDVYERGIIDYVLVKAFKR